MVFLNRPVEPVTEEWRLGILAVVPISEIAPQGIAAGFAHINDTAFTAFGATQGSVFDLDPTGLYIEIGNRQRAEFIGS